jgi:hypothetical protein
VKWTKRKSRFIGSGYLKLDAGCRGYVKNADSLPVTSFANLNAQSGRDFKSHSDLLTPKTTLYILCSLWSADRRPKQFKLKPNETTKHNQKKP